MSELISGPLISGKEALLALANGEDVQLQVLGDMNWHDSNQWTVGELLCFKGRFRLKPKTITINSVEIPAPFIPKESEVFYYLDSEYEEGYNSTKYKEGYPHFGKDKIQFGAWDTEEKIKQVVEVLRGIFNG